MEGGRRRPWCRGLGGRAAPTGATSHPAWQRPAARRAFRAMNSTPPPERKKITSGKVGLSMSVPLGMAGLAEKVVHRVEEHQAALAIRRKEFAAQPLPDLTPRLHFLVYVDILGLSLIHI